MSYTLELAIWSRDTSQQIPCFDRCQLIVVVVVRTRPRAMLLAMITMRKSTHGFPFLSHMSIFPIWAPLGGPSGRRSSAINFIPFIKIIFYKIYFIY